MFESIKAWVYKHRKGLIITGTVVSIAGTVVVMLINGKKVKMSVNELARRIIPDVSKSAPSKVLANISQGVIPAAAEATEMVTVEVDGVLKTFPRSDFIRILHEGWHASKAKLAQAAQMGIDLKPGETIVNACTVTMKAARR